jgi:hypothetical protein
MDFEAKRSFRPKQNNRDPRRVAVLVLGTLATVFALSCVVFLTPKRDFTNYASPAATEDLPPYWGWLESNSATASPANTNSRPVFAYSVIPGGVGSSAELKLALKRDPIAASHYAGFRAQAARPVRLAQARQVYVSYRIGSQIFWTSKRVTLRAGETLLSDGTHLVRGRCGNRISSNPVRPTAAAEPPEPALNAPALPSARVETANRPPAAPIWSEHATPLLLASAPAPPPPGNIPFVAPRPPVPCCGGRAEPHTPVPTATPPVPPPPVIPQPEPGPPPLEPSRPSPPLPDAPPVATPEPQTLELIVVGLLGALVGMKLRRA